MTLDILNMWRRELASEVLVFTTNALNACKNVGDIYRSLNTKLINKRSNTIDDDIYRSITQRISDFTKYANDKEIGDMCKNQVKILKCLRLIHEENNRTIRKENVIRCMVIISSLSVSALVNALLFESYDSSRVNFLALSTVMSFCIGIVFAYNTYAHKGAILNAKTIIVINETTVIPIAYKYALIESTKVNDYYFLHDCLINAYNLSKKFLAKINSKVSEINIDQFKQKQTIGIEC